ncbi:MAG: GspH/FimT family pseudopilin [Sulfuricaulis sp.]|nr:GspH/FimT family pseudopilin [Sulfuricaulis sp.]
MQHGTTLIEMLIGIAILGILIAVGLPSYRGWIQNTQIRTAAESVLNGMQLARNEAVRRNINVQLVLGAQSTWTITVPSTAEQIQTRTYGEGSKNVTVTKTPGAATTITFSSLGRVVANGDASATLTQLDFDVPAAILSAAESRDLRIVVSAGGNVRMCDPTVTNASDTRFC